MNYIILLIILISSYYFYKFWSFDKKSNINGPKPWPLIGNIHHFGIKQPQLTLFRLSKKYNNIFRMFIFDKPTIICSDPILIKEMFVDNYEIFKNRPLSAGILHADRNTGIVVSNHGTYERNKKVLIKVLNNNSIYNYYNEKSLEFVKFVNNEFQELNNSGADENEAIVLKNTRFYLKFFTMSIMYKFVFNETISISKKDNNVYAKEIKFIHSANKGVLFIYAFFSVMVNFMSFLKPLYVYYLKNYDKKMPKILNFFKTKYNSKKGEINSESLVGELIDEYSKDSSIKNVDENISTMCFDTFFGSVENTTYAIEWVFIMLINHKEYQDLIYNELKSLKKEVITTKEREKTPLLNSFINETLRLYPTIPLYVPHECSKDVVIGGKFVIPVGSQVIVNAKAIALNEKVFKDASKFIGDRFIKSKKEYESFLSFGVGNRMCPAQDFGTLQIYCLISNLILKFKFDSVSGYPLSENEFYQSNLSPNKFNIKFIKRN